MGGAPQTLGFVARLPLRYGDIGVLPGRGLWANGGWYPQVLGPGGEARVATWDVRLDLPAGVVGVLNGQVGEGRLEWSGDADRAAIAVLPNARVTELPARRGRVRLVELRRPERAVARQAALALEEVSALEHVLFSKGSGSVPGPPDLVIIEDLDLLRLARAAPGMVYLSDRAFRLTPGLRRYHRSALRREILAARLQASGLADGWVRDFAASALADALPSPSARKLLGWFSWNPLVDALLYDGTLPYFADTFDEPFGGPPGLFEALGARIPGRVAALQLDDRMGEGTAASLARQGTGGTAFDVAAEAVGIPPEIVAAWALPYVPTQDYAVIVTPDAARIERRAPPEAPSEVVIVRVGERTLPAWVTGPGPAILPIAPTSEPVRVDPEGHVAETDRANNRWPEKWTLVVNGGFYHLSPSQGAFKLAAELYFRHQNDSRNLFLLGAAHDAQDLVGLDLGFIRWLGPLKDRRTRTHRVSVFFGPALLDPAFRPTESGAVAIGWSVGYSWDTRTDAFFALSGHRRALSVGGGFIPGSEERWAAAAISAVQLFSPHPRHVLAVRAKAAWASGGVEHRLLPLGGAGEVRAVPEAAVLGNERIGASVEYRVAPLRNASVPIVGLAWLSEVHLSPGVDAGVVWRGPDQAAAVGATLGLHVLVELLGARPSLAGVTAAVPVWTEGVSADGPQVYIDFSHPF